MPMKQKERASALVRSLEPLWVRARTYVYAHKARYRIRRKWLNTFWYMTFGAAIFTVIVSGLNATLATLPEAKAQEPVEATDPQENQDATRENEKNKPPPGTPLLPATLLWLTVTGAVLTGVSKVGEQYFGPPDNLRMHNDAVAGLEREMYLLDDLAARVFEFMDGRSGETFDQLQESRVSVDADIRERNELVPAPHTDKHASAAQDDFNDCPLDLLIARLGSRETVNPSEEDNVIRRVPRG